MAVTGAGRQLTGQHRQAQLGVRAATVRDFAALWAAFDITVEEDFSSLANATVTLVAGRHRDSATVAGRYFGAYRTAEGIRGDAPVRLAERIAPSRVVRSLAATGRAGVLRSIGKGFSPQAARQNGLVRASGAMGRLALDGGRQTIVDSTNTDRRAVGWNRVTDASPCAFCAMVASRGPVYRSERSADFESHDHCGCSAEPAYDDDPDTWPGRNRELRELWNRAQRDAREAGELNRDTANDALNAFRRALSAGG